METNNYKDYDTLKLYARKDRSESIIEHYKLFGWELVDKVDNARYEDTIDLTFTRPHKIENKDELQLLQVYMEERLNELAKLEKNKYSKSLIFGLCNGVIGVAFLVLSAIAFLGLILPVRNIVGFISLAIGLMLLTIMCILLPRFIKKDRNYYEARTAELEIEIMDICDNVTSLIGGEYGRE